MKNSVWPAVAGLGFVCALGAVIARGRPVGDIWGTDSPAAWAQAILSCVGVCVAVWVSSDQHAKAQQRDAERERTDVTRMALSLADEMESLWEIMDSRLGPLLGDTSQGTHFQYVFNTPERPFCVYDSHVHRIGAIEVDTLRRQVITTYVKAMGLLATFRTNNELVAEFKAAVVISERTPSIANNQIAEHYGNLLAGYGAQLREAYNAVGIMTHDLSRELRDYASSRSEP